MGTGTCVAGACSRKLDPVRPDIGASICGVVPQTVAVAGEVLVGAAPEPEPKPCSLTDRCVTIQVPAKTQGRRRVHLLVDPTRTPGEARRCPIS